WRSRAARASTSAARAARGGPPRGALTTGVAACSPGSPATSTWRWRASSRRGRWPPRAGCAARRRAPRAAPPRTPRRGPLVPRRPAPRGPDDGGCRVFPGIACDVHVAVASELAAGPLAAPRERRFPPRATVCRPTGEPEAELEGRELSPEALDQAVARLQDRLGAPRGAHSR